MLRTSPFPSYWGSSKKVTLAPVKELKTSVSGKVHSKAGKVGTRRETFVQLQVVLRRLFECRHRYLPSRVYALILVCTCMYKAQLTFQRNVTRSEATLKPDVR